MPLTRYQIRNEYSLADPELYRAADRDDPEALLEGVAMAGLVGVLRQLGDLAEFAAEIFHDLHEELMATAARGHSLTLRVQQLEADFPPIEKAFLTQTTHSQFIHNPGVVWHPNLQVDQNLITRGDLPRCVMDSYEECRGPPRLFLLDKFDIAGAGACLKRYSDPSFFRAEFTSSKAKKDGDKREKRARKIKKKVPRWKNIETSELTTSHIKLHQLFSEEHCHSEHLVRPRHAKLKKRLSSSILADATTGKSYMERFVHSPSDKKSVRERSGSPLRLKMGSSNCRELVPEIHEIFSTSPTDKLVTRDESHVPSLSTQEKAFDQPPHEFSEDVFVEDNLNKSLVLTPDVELESIPSVLDKVEDKKELSVYNEGKVEADLYGYRSDDAFSEVEKYVDALATMDSETETDLENRPKNALGFKIEKKWVDSGANEKYEEIQTRSLNSLSMESSVASDNGNNLFKKGRSSLSYSDTSSNSTENVPSNGDVAGELHEHKPAENLDSSSKRTFGHGKTNVRKFVEYGIPNSTCSDVSRNPSYVPQSGEAFCNSGVSGLTCPLRDSSSGLSSDEVQFFELNSVEISSSHMNSIIGESSPRTEVGGDNMGDDLPCSTNVSNTPSNVRDHSLSFGSHESQPMEIVDGGGLDVSYDSLNCLPNVLGPAGEEDYDSAVFESTLPKVADDSRTEKVVNVKIGLSDSVNLHTEADEAGINGLAEQDLRPSSSPKTAPDNIPESPIDGNLDDATVLHGLSEQDIVPSSSPRTAPENIPESPIDGNLDVRPDSIAVGIGDVLRSGEKSKHWTSIVDSSENDDSIEQKIPEVMDQVPPLERIYANGATSELEISCYNLEVEDESAPTKVCDSSGADGNIDALIGSPTGYTSDEKDAVSLADTHSGVADLESTNVCAVENGDKIVDHMTPGSPCVDPLKLREFLFSNGDSQPDVEDKAENQSVPFDYNIGPVKCTQTHLNENDSTEAPLSSEDSKKKTSNSHLSVSMNGLVSSSIHLPEPGVPLEQGLTLEAVKESIPSLQDDCEDFKSGYHQSEQTEPLNQIHSDGCFTAHPLSSSVDPLSQPSDPSLSLLASYKSEISELSPIPLQGISTDIGMYPEATKSDRQLPTSTSDLSLPVHNALAASEEESPPLPPLPPVQWRLGKLRHGSPSPNGEMVQHSFNPFSQQSTEAADAETKQGFPTFFGELAHPPNPFLFRPTSDNEVLPHLQEGEMVQPSLNPSSSHVAHNSDEIQLDSRILSTTVTVPLKPFSPLADEEPPHDSSDLVGEVLQPTSLNILTAAPTIDDANAQPVTSTSHELEKSLEALVPEREDGELHHTSLASNKETMQPPSSFTPPPIEIENPGHGSRTLEGETEWQPNLSVIRPNVEDEKPDGTLKIRIPRPRDPLIEAVASHDKSNLRKVTERVLPEKSPKAGERNSLLEQIRNKSFNLKPAAVTRPSIQGPRTNLKVVAILEKANAIRQALAGSDDDDDDEDSWSDS